MTLTLTHHQVAAAIQVARLIDDRGNGRGDARSSYLTTATDQAFSPSSLRAGEGLLLAANLLRLEDGRLVPTVGLRSLAAIEEVERAAATLSRLIDERARDVDRTAIGSAGEEHVLAEVRGELEALDRPDLAAMCERVSLVSDYFGFDITAPLLGAGERRLEVKTQTVVGPVSTIRFYLSRNEYDVGRRNPAEWALVACTRSAADVIETVGWCRAATLNGYLPQDQGGRWTEAQVQIPTSLLIEGFPPAV